MSLRNIGRNFTRKLAAQSCVPQKYQHFKNSIKLESLLTGEHCADKIVFARVVRAGKFVSEVFQKVAYEHIMEV